MRHEEHSVLVSSTSLLVSSMEHYGLDPHAIAKTAGIDFDQILRPHDRISWLKLQRVWQCAVEQSGDSCFGLTIGNIMQPMALSGLGYSWIASNTLEEGIHRLVRYQRMISTVFDISCEEQQQGYSIQVNFFPSKMPIVPASMDGVMSSLIKIFKIMSGEEFSPTSVSFQHPMPSGEDSKQRFQDYFSSPVIFNAKKNEIIINKEIMEYNLPMANPELTRINDFVVVEYLKQFDKDDVLTQTRAIIIEQLSSGSVHQGEIATILNLSLRNFQRRLKKKGTSFSQLLDDIRTELAIQYLTDSHRQVIEIAFLLGFSSSGSFTRAFKRWTGTTPLKYANEH